MPSHIIGNFFMYAIINAFTPGPGNILAMNTVTNYGWRRGNPLFLGIFAGYYVVQFICAVFVYGVSAFLPNVLSVMKYAGAAYIFWLAVHIAVSKPAETVRNTPPPSSGDFCCNLSTSKSTYSESPP